MDSSLKKILRRMISVLVNSFGQTRIGNFLFEQILSDKMNAKDLVLHRNTQLIFSTPNRINRFRVDSFSTKEPETLEWIDNFPIGSILWDIGANVGLYSCYAAKARDCKVYAFEPSVFNLEILARNIFLNNLVANVAIIPFPLSDKSCLSKLKMTSMEWGGALSTFGQDYGWDGQKLKQIFEFQTMGFSGDDALKTLELAQPNYLKIDVDGIEHLILTGAKKILAKVDGVLIEINDDFHEQAEQTNKLLSESGLLLMEKRHSDMFSTPESFGGGKVWNQIWTRKSGLQA